MAEFQVRKERFAECRLVESATTEAVPEIGQGEIAVRVDRFAFTANNITYAAAGEQLGYWQFFPPTGNDADGWGVIPVWGFADVVASKAEGVGAGERLFGYFPPASYLTMTPVGLSPQRLIEGAAHRAQLPDAYNSYSRVTAKADDGGATEAERMLLWPLFVTAFCLWDQLQAQGWYGAQQVVILSASSKTSIGLAYALADDGEAPPAVALTSTGNRAMVESLDVYDQCLAYDALTAVDASLPTVIVDMSGNGDVLGRLHAHLGDNMRHCVKVGLTHWKDTAPSDGVNAGRSKFFFAPSHIQQRMQEWGPEVFAQRSEAFMQQAALRSRRWLILQQVEGLQGLAAGYPDICAGRVPADRGLIVDL